MMCTWTHVWAFATFLFSLCEATPSCPPPYTAHPYGLCLYYCRISKSWYEARDNCIAIMGELVKEDTPELNNIFKNLSQANSGSKYWISLGDMLKEGEFRWLDGQHLSWTNWGPDKPDGTGGVNCVISHRTDNWADRTCSQIHDSICQYKGCQNAANMKLIQWEGTNDLSNTEIADSLTADNRAECASKCYLRSVCDGIVYNQTLSTCTVLKLRDGSSVNISIVNNEVFVLGNI